MKERVRFAVVGLGYIAQVAVLPAFAHARQHAKLAALVSGDPEKLKLLAREYGVDGIYSYQEYEDLLQSGEIDAVYIALPNSLHCEYTVKAARAGIHVLCEKPMATTVADCEEMIRTCSTNAVKLMIAYRLHFEAANLQALETVRSGTIGEPRAFTSIFSMQVAHNNIRTLAELGGGSMWDLGIYCLNAARQVFQDEPERVLAMVANPRDNRFEEVDGLTGAILGFNGGKVATIISSFCSQDLSFYEVLGTNGALRVEPAFEFQSDLAHELMLNGRSRKTRFRSRDQFAPELIRFSECIMNDEEPESSGEEGLADVRVLEAIYQSAEMGAEVLLPPFEKRLRPELSQELNMPPVRRVRLFHAQDPARQ